MSDYFKNKAAEWDSPFKVDLASKFVQEMLKNIKLDKSVKALDLGCGTGLVGLQIACHVKSLVMLDSSKAMIDKLKEKLSGEENRNGKPFENIRVMKGSIEKYKAKNLNLIFSLMAFHHIENIQETADHISDILKPDGMLAIADLKEEDGSFHGESIVPHNGFNIEQLARQLKFSGLNVLTTYIYNTINKQGKDYEQFILIAQKNIKL